MEVRRQLLRSRQATAGLPATRVKIGSCYSVGYVGPSRSGALYQQYEDCRWPPMVADDTDLANLVSSVVVELGQRFRRCGP